MLRLVVVY